MYSAKENKKDDENTFTKKSSKSNLKIVIENALLTDQTDSIEIDNDENNNNNNNKDDISDVSEEECGLEVDIPENEIECTFSVNLDKMPPTLQNTILNEKIYLNESLKLESNPPENLNEISQEDLDSLYQSLGLNQDSFVKDSSQTDLLLSKENLYDKKKLHLFGTDELSTQDIFDYFKDYKAIAVEWINDSSCNVIWRNEIHAANALLGMSKPIKLEEEEEENSNKKFDSEPVDINKPKIINLKQASLARKSLKPPRNTKWRIGVKSIKDYQIYMRYMRQTDRKQKGAELRSEYYRKYGNPNYGNMTGLISMSKRERMKSQQINDAVSDLTDLNHSTNSKRNLISYELDDDYNLDNLEESFGTNKTPTSLIKENNNLNEKSKSNEKKLRLYSDDLINDHSHHSKDRLNSKRKNRYEPYESNKKSRRLSKSDNEDDDDDENSTSRYNKHRSQRNQPEDLRNKLNKLRSQH